MRNGGSGGETTEAATKKMVAPFKLPEMALRLCVIPLTLASLWEMVTNKQADDAYGEVKFSDLSGFKYLVAAYLLVTSGSAAAEVLYLAREGDRELYWSEVCSYFGRFCGRATVSVALHAAALLCFVALSLISAFRVFSKCDAPGAAADCSESKHAEEQGK